jgi:hypothetical protein
MLAESAGRANRGLSLPGVFGQKAASRTGLLPVARAIHRRAFEPEKPEDHFS